MNTITFLDGRRVEYSSYQDFISEKNRLYYREREEWVSYYDSHGDNHICLVGDMIDSVIVLGKTLGVPYGEFGFDVAADYVKSERFDEFCGWTR